MSWVAMLLLGAYHGINPGMGWLFAVALGLQRGSAWGVGRALPPIALGHAAAVGVVVALAASAKVVIRDLAIWSFLMASAHGAGLMVLPFVMATTDVAAAASPHAGHSAAAGLSLPVDGVLAVGLHSAAYLAVTAAMAWVVYRWIGLAILRTAWFNLDWLWAAALVVTGIVVLAI